MIRLLLLFLLAGVVPAVAQDARLEGKFSPGAMRAIGAMLDSSRVEGLPTEPLILKSLEGVSKGAPEPRIVVVVGEVLASLRSARVALGPETPATDLAAGAAALRAGVTPSALERLRRARPPGRLAVPLGLLTDLVSGGMAPGAAEERVVDLARSGASDADFVSLGRRLASPRTGREP